MSLLPPTILREEIRDLLLREFAPHLTASHLGFDDDLADRGAIDSLRMVEFILLLEQRFGIRVEPSRIVPETFGSIETIAAYVEDRQHAAMSTDGGSASAWSEAGSIGKRGIRGRA